MGDPSSKRKRSTKRALSPGNARTGTDTSAATTTATSATTTRSGSASKPPRKTLRAPDPINVGDGGTWHRGGQFGRAYYDGFIVTRLLSPREAEVEFDRPIRIGDEQMQEIRNPDGPGWLHRIPRRKPEPDPRVKGSQPMDVQGRSSDRYGWAYPHGRQDHGGGKGMLLNGEGEENRKKLYLPIKFYIKKKNQK